MKKKWRCLAWLFYALAAVYLGLLVFPQVVFAEKVQYKSFVVYAHAPLNEQVFEVLDSAESLISKSEFYRPGQLQQALFFCDSFQEFAFFAPSAIQAFAVNYPVTQHIFLSKSSIPRNQIWAATPANNRRKLSAVIAHETTHTLLQNALGFLGELQLPTWKKEGYADYIARESSYGWHNGLRTFCEGPGKASGAYRYFTYRLFVTHLLQSHQKTFAQVSAQPYSPDSLANELQKKLCP